MSADQPVPRDICQGLNELTAEQVAERLELSAHPEGGYYRETYRSSLTVETDWGPRPLCTNILYLMAISQPSRLHRLRSDELWFFHAGAPVELVLLEPQPPSGSSQPRLEVIGLDRPQALVPAGVWMGARVLAEGEADWGSGRAPERRWTPDRRLSADLRWTLVSCVVTPGFDFADFELGVREALMRDFPQARAAIHALT